MRSSARSRLRLYPRHRLDLSVGHLVYAAAALAWARDAEALTAAVERIAGEDAIVCCSVRSGFELLLDALELPAGSDVLVSAVTHPDMAHILERHGLVPVPVDLDPATLAPRLELAADAVTSRTRAFLVAHLFGGRVDLEPLAVFARERDLLLLEDCAQSWRGPTDRGDARADVTMVSFGSIKTAPALGGAVLHVRRKAVLARMQELQATWPQQHRVEFAARIARFLVLVILQNPAVYGSFVRAGRRLGRDVDALVNGSVRALRPPSSDAGDDFGVWLRRRPSAPLVALLRHRRCSFDAARLRRRAVSGDEIARRLPESVVHPGRDARDRTHWVFPVVAPDPARLVDALLDAGFDATRATTSIAAVDAPVDRPERRPAAALELMERVVFLPTYPELPRPALERLLEAVAEGGADGDANGR